MEIADDYVCTTDCWWTIKYDFGTQTSMPTDRTVWSVLLLDPEALPATTTTTTAPTTTTTTEPEPTTTDLDHGGGADHHHDADRGRAGPDRWTLTRAGRHPVGSAPGARRTTGGAPRRSEQQARPPRSCG